ncbi:MAG: signal peptidase I [Anaerolineae bacterium]|nr:signal peptidase I [Anaerolineae bacterium]
MLIFVALLIAAQWKIFVKAGKPGWAAIVPIYNIVILLELVGRPLWFIILFFIPLLNVVAAILLAIDLALSFGKDMVYAILIILFSPIMLLVLGFGSAEYVGPGAAKNPIFPAN